MKLRKMLLYFGTCILMGGATARPTPYVLQVQTKNPDQAGVLRLINSRTKRALWTWKVLGTQLREAHWSSDGRAVAYETSGYILIWREGYPLLQVRFPPGNHAGLGVGDGNGVFTNTTNDYSLDYKWSLDKRRILVRFSGSGGADIGPEGTGLLYCLKFTGGKHPRYRWILPFRGLVWKMSWRDNHTAFYYPFKDAGKHWFLPARLWKVP